MDNLSRCLPPLRALLALEAAVRCGSFTAAARELNVSQPAVSRQIKVLEEALGIAIFSREHRRVVLTDAGKIYHESVASCLVGIAEAGRNLARIASPERVTIYANYGLAAYWLMPRLTHYQDVNPDIEIVVRTVEQEQRLSDTEFEIAIRFGDGIWRDGDVRPLFNECGFPVCSPGYVSDKGPITTVEALSQHRLLKVQTENQAWLDWAGFFREFGLKHQGYLGSTYNNYTLAIQAALAGQGIALGWDQIVDDFLQRGWLVRPIKEEVVTELGYYTVASHSVASSKTLDDILGWLHSKTSSSAVLPADILFARG